MINPSIIILRLLQFGILITPLMGLLELIQLLKGGSISQATALTPVWVKLMKDLVILASLGIYLLYIFFHGRILRPRWGFSSFYVLLISFTIATAAQIPIMATVGLRALLPLFMIFPGSLLRKEDLPKILNSLAIVFFLELAIQVLQLYFVRHYGVSERLGVSIRNPGTFLIPNTMAFFALFTLAISHSVPGTSKLSKSLQIFVPISVALTASGTGIICWFGMIFYQAFLRVRPRVAVVFTALVGVIGGLIALPLLSNRSNIWQSMDERLNPFRNMTISEFWIGSGFGSATNTGVLLANSKMLGNSIEAKVVDSTLSFLIFNMGFLSIPLFLALFLPIVFGRSTLGLGFWLVVGLFSITTIMFECYPMNFLIFVLIGQQFALREKL